MQPLETERLILRPLTINDAEELHREIYGDLEVVRYYSRQGVLTLDGVRQRLRDHLVVWAEEELGRHAVVLKQGNQFLGQVHLNGYVNSFQRWQGEPATPYNPLEVELAFAFGRHFWGQGYAFEACQAVISYSFETLRLRRLVGGAYLQNDRSVQLHRRLGYRVELNQMPGEEGYVTILDNPALAAGGAQPAP